MGRKPEIFLDYLRAPSPAREATVTLPPPLRDSANLLTRSWTENEQRFSAEMPVGEQIIAAQLHSHRSILYMMSVAEKVKAELDRMLEARDQAMGLFEKMEGERAAIAAERQNYEDRLNKIGVELNAQLDSEVKLLEENAALKTWGEKANKRAAEEKRRADDLQAQLDAERAKAVEQQDLAKKRVEEAEAKALNAVDSWRASSEFDAVSQDAYVVALEEIVKYIGKERPDFDTSFLEEALEEQRKELERLSTEAGVHLSPADEDVEKGASPPPAA